ncbi:hypothetical protein [Nocardia camponoti]|uniref:hypothetical protein n=1 Tax=Nocardia camponoti TaxID=1616106 RepID=UPI00166BD375|nr:hypothetical protein [Nocardia camponoti]
MNEPVLSATISQTESSAAVPQDVSIPAGVMPVRRPADERPRLDALSEKGIAEFPALFGDAASVTDSDFARISGDLVMRSFPCTGAKFFARFMNKPTYFWLGKSFRHAEPGVAYGHNIFRFLGGVRGLNFVATIKDSELDGRPAVVMDYDDARLGSRRPGRAIYDELREVEPGLWLGPSFHVRNGKKKLMGWCVLDASVPFDGLF